MNHRHWRKWAFSAEGRPIELFASPPETETSEPPILFVGGVHGDEPEGVLLAQRTLDWLCSQPSAGIRPWRLIPCLNPDGYHHQKRQNGNGVDLNRNYPATNWSAEYSDVRYYPGPSAGSEPEIQALIHLIQNITPRLILHCHSWKPCIVLTGPPAQTEAQHLCQSSGYPLVKSIGYKTPGSLSDYGWYDSGIPVICIEEQEKASKEAIWQRFQSGIQNLFSPRYY